MDPIVSAALVSAGGRLAGQLLGGSGGGLSGAEKNMMEKQLMNQHEWNWRSFNSNRWQYARSMQEQRRQFNKAYRYTQWQDWKKENQAIRRRVSDARAAGLHPLFALGISPSAGGSISMSGAPSPTGFIPGQSPVGSFADGGYQEGVGQALGDAVGTVAKAWSDSKMNREELARTEKMRNLQVKLLEAQVAESQARSTADFARASAYTSAAKSGTSARMVKSPAPTSMTGTPDGAPYSASTALGRLGYGRHDPIDEMERYFGDAASFVGFVNLLNQMGHQIGTLAGEERNRLAVKDITSPSRLKGSTPITPITRK